MYSPKDFKHICINSNSKHLDSNLKYLKQQQYVLYQSREKYSELLKFCGFANSCILVVKHRYLLSFSILEISELTTNRKEHY